MRQIILDTETTGLDARQGNRILELGCVELVNRRLTGNNLHFYINPERDSEEGALRVHGLTTAFLADKPKFAEIAQNFLEYIRDAEVIIHNATFDVNFLNAEFDRLGLKTFPSYVNNIIDSLLLARDMFPGKRNSLDALCDRLGVSNTHRTLHGALLDAEILAEVYVAMTRGQESLLMDEPVVAQEKQQAVHAITGAGIELVTIQVTSEEDTLHQHYLASLDKESKGNCIWLNANKHASAELN